MNERAEGGAAIRSPEVTEQAAEERVTMILERVLEASGMCPEDQARAQAEDTFRELQLSEESLRELVAQIAPRG